MSLTDTEWAGLDSNQRSAYAADLQSAGFNHSPTDPYLFRKVFISLSTLQTYYNTSKPLCQ